ncbi:MAG: hypothetical protein JXB26_07960 [Candidatus Aminicenantes bacterium]|nr:hypothetical protein [Candidatus Aminicenantes bacterium]
MKKITAASLGILVLFVGNSLAVKPQKWELNNFGQYIEGKCNGVSVSYDGVLSLAPREEEVNGPSEEFYLSLIVDPNGDIFLGTGHGGKIYRIGKEGEPELYFQVPEMDVTCLVRDVKGHLYAGTSPNGKIYKITEKGKGDVFFNPREKYIWDLFYSSKGVLLAAVGESGGIYEINDNGEGRRILDSKENHVLCLVRGRNGTLLAGTGGKGRIYAISPEYTSSVLYETPFEEVKSIVLDGWGNIYAAASGKVVEKKEKTESSDPSQTRVSVSVSAASSAAEALLESLENNQGRPGALYKIGPDGLAERLWFSPDEMIYSLFWRGPEKKIVFGTGKKGRVYSMDMEHKVSLLMEKDSEQVYGLYPFRDRIYVIVNNPARLILINPEGRMSGEYLSRVWDCSIISSWGRIEWETESPEGTLLQFQTRSGNSSDPEASWSDWSPPYQKTGGEQILSPKARFIQFRILLKADSGRETPLVKKTSLYFLQANKKPEITALSVFPSNLVFIKPPVQEEAIWGQALDSSEMARNSEKTQSLVSAKRTEKLGFQTLAWEAEDINGDHLVYSVEIKEENGSKWRILKDNWTEKIFAFDTRLYNDGNYFLKVKASDSPSNPRGNELSSEKISRILVFDNSIPEINNFGVVRRDGKIIFTFLATDRFTAVKEIQFLVRPHEWQVIFPEDGICDSKSERVEIVMNQSPDLDDMITIKVEDAQGNVGVFRRIY